MKIFDPSAYPELKALFPELTPVQFEISLLFSPGTSQKEISLLRGANYTNVRQALAESKTKFEPQSLTGLLTAFQVRIVFFALYGCKRHLPQITEK